MIKKFWNNSLVNGVVFIIGGLITTGIGIDDQYPVSLFIGMSFVITGFLLIHTGIQKLNSK